ncbi:hypothetical protein EQW78_12220 [Oerskovia turbata]|uniref:Uncharacterized protein n=2 Tax=Oerskovia TaxID=162491 RepID=A0A4Q1KVL6_9CELL|nr:MULTISPECIES: hypothetical protein [Oerskovia]TGJ96314.1 hypothetical protein DLJ96_11315 [Actinotalea fermentans ATCC 43279 = JCM 9966 = DSM 3133]MBD7950067.1 hypothetical protein [Oerskovia rustica]QDW62133.1 hypothetical protein FFI11_005920 [Oerskovia sp. KBS0722]RXR25668.1 hypothetical protein EQW73_09125 [Oerskovia turbata]RXR33244.1 hypothetical protein EQW78_12220 [Oerskovia turbata]
MLTLLSGSSVFGAHVIDCVAWVTGMLGAAPGRVGAIGSRIEAVVADWGWFGPTGEMTERIAYTPLRVALALFLVTAVAAVAALVSSLLTRRSR